MIKKCKISYAIFNCSCILRHNRLLTATTDFSIIRWRTSTECRIWDSYKKSFGYPIIYKNTGNLKIETFTPSIESYISISSNFLSNGYIEFEIEYPNESTTDVNFTVSKNNAFYIYFKIVDIEDEKTQDQNLAALNINDSVVSNGHNIGSQKSILQNIAPVRVRIEPRTIRKRSKHVTH
jgi:hypothetical protein